VGKYAAVHGVDPEAVEESKIVVLGIGCADFLHHSVAAIICRSWWRLKLVLVQADTHSPAQKEPALRVAFGFYLMHPLK
jgi:hypothetical protein